MDPQTVLNRLIEGNGRFANGAPEHPNQGPEHRSDLVDGQAPAAMVLGCADSRVPAEIVFDTGLGELFVVRTAGQALDSAVIGSLEFGANQLGISLLVVLGHENCGAVTAAAGALDGGEFPGGYLDSIVTQLTRPLQKAQLEGKNDMSDYVDANVLAISRRLVQESVVLRDAVSSGKLQIVPMTYDLHNGLARQLQQ